MNDSIYSYSESSLKLKYKGKVCCVPNCNNKQGLDIARFLHCPQMLSLDKQKICPKEYYYWFAPNEPDTKYGLNIACDIYGNIIRAVNGYVLLL